MPDIEHEWRRMRSSAKTAFGKGDWQSVLRRVAEFDRFCDQYGWPDWWSDMTRLRNDAQLQLDREESI